MDLLEEDFKMSDRYIEELEKCYKDLHNRNKRLDKLERELAKRINILKGNSERMTNFIECAISPARLTAVNATYDDLTPTSMSDALNTVYVDIIPASMNRDDPTYNFFKWDGTEFIQIEDDEELRKEFRERHESTPANTGHMEYDPADENQFSYVENNTEDGAEMDPNDAVVEEDDSTEEYDPFQDTVSTPDHSCDLTLTYKKFADSHECADGVLKDTLIDEFLENFKLSLYTLNPTTGVHNHTAYRNLVNAFELDGYRTFLAIVMDRYELTIQKLSIDYEKMTIRIRLHLHLVLPTVDDVISAIDTENRYADLYASGRGENTDCMDLEGSEYPDTSDQDDIDSSIL